MGRAITIGRNVKRLQINDADIALFGALEGRPGIICIQGEGSMVLAKTESGRMVRNFDFLHYANAAAPRTGFRATYAVLSGADDPDEADFVAEVLRHWGANSIEELREAAANWYSNREAALRTAGRLAPAVTKAADDGLPAAVRICRLAASEIAEGVALLGPFFEGQEVEVSLSGSCGRSPAISRGVQDALVSRQEKTYRFVEPRFSAVEGAVLWALGLAGVELSLEIKANLRSSPCRGSAGCSAAQNLE
jgi:glucosamine kinase